MPPLIFDDAEEDDCYVSVTRDDNGVVVGLAVTSIADRGDRRDGSDGRDGSAPAELPPPQQPSWMRSDLDAIKPWTELEAISAPEPSPQQHPAPLRRLLWAVLAAVAVSAVTIWILQWSRSTIAAASQRRGSSDPAEVRYTAGGGAAQPAVVVRPMAPVRAEANDSRRDVRSGPLLDQPRRRRSRRGRRLARRARRARASAVDADRLLAIGAQRALQAMKEER